VRYLLDTCFISEFQKPHPAAAIREWLEQQHEGDLYLSVLTLGEIQKGISQLSDGRKKKSLQSWLDRDLRERFQDRIVHVSEEVAVTWGRIAGELQRSGSPIPVVDGLIAATSLSIGATVVTRNDTHISRAGARTLNPWNA
jgi:predicted nucleic acid-binding protein